MFDLEEMKKSTPISDLADHFGLDRQGNAAYCVFHDDKSGPKRSLVLQTRVNKFKCESCQESGSVIDLTKGALNCSEGPAIQYLADLYNFHETNDSTRSVSNYKHSTDSKAKSKKPKQASISKYQPPPKRWQMVMFEYLKSANLYLNYSQEAASYRKWLRNERGLNQTTIRQKLAWFPYSIKWDPKNKIFPGEKIWISDGLALACLQDEQLQRIKIRRVDDNPKYAQVQGSSSVPATLGNQNSLAAIILESDLDGFLVDQEAGNLAQIVVLGSASNKPDQDLIKKIHTKDIVLVSLDVDEAGIKALPWWFENFPNAIRWPSVRGKDPGEDFQNGVDIRTWVKAGLSSCNGYYCEKVSFENDYDARIQWCNEASCAIDDLLLADCHYNGCPLGKWKA
jgi:DNA primase